MYDRDTIILARQAFLAGAAWMCDMNAQGLSLNANAMAEGRRRYPLPKVTRPRVVRDPLEPELRWTIRDGEPRLYDRDRPNCFMPTKARVALWADLLANPNEEVEDDS